MRAKKNYKFSMFPFMVFQSNWTNRVFIVTIIINNVIQLLRDFRSVQQGNRPIRLIAGRNCAIYKFSASTFVCDRRRQRRERETIEFTLYYLFRLIKFGHVFIRHIDHHQSIKQSIVSFQSSMIMNDWVMELMNE